MSQNEDFIITGSKDSHLIWQKFSNAYCPFDDCNKAALGFNIDDMLIFRSEYFTSKPVYESTELKNEKKNINALLQKTPIENLTPSILKKRKEANDL